MFALNCAGCAAPHLLFVPEGVACVARWFKHERSFSRKECIAILRVCTEPTAAARLVALDAPLVFEAQLSNRLIYFFLDTCSFLDTRTTDFSCSLCRRQKGAQGKTRKDRKARKGRRSKEGRQEVNSNYKW